METRSGDMVSAQIGNMGIIKDLDKKDFELANGQPFQIKNDTNTIVQLRVQLASMNDGESIITTFPFGWSPEIVKKVIKGKEGVNANLKWGY